MAASPKLVYDIVGRDNASAVFDKVARSVERSGGRMHGAFGKAMGSVTALAGGAGLGALVVSSVKSAASFETTMRQIAASTGAPSTSIKGLSALAIKMGQDTVFSAQEAGSAMLELARGGMNEAQIRAGSLASTLTLATAGGLDLANAAGYIVQGLTTFNLSADRSADVAAALAGAANASTASVEDMGLALSQVGPGAKLAGLSLQETAGILALFANNGVKGSDAGTSLKTMLARLVPTTTAARKAMRDLGLSFTDAHGNIRPIADIAGQLQVKLGKLSDAQRTAALTTIFGSDATRAASILMKEGTKGVIAATKATSDKAAADKMAKATTEGMAGALSQLSGSIDTAKLQLGQALAPLVTDLAEHMTGWANTLSTKVIPAVAGFVKGIEDGTGPGGELRDVVGELGSAAEGAWKVAKPFFGFIGDHPKLFTEVAKDAVIFAGALKAIGAVKGLGAVGGGKGGVGGAGSIGKPIPVFVTNPGFGAGGKGVPVPGVPGGGKAPGKLGRFLGSGVGANAVLLADAVLVPKAVASLKRVFNMSFDLSVNEKTKQFVADLDSADLGPVLRTHAQAVYDAAAEAARTGNTSQLQQALQTAYGRAYAIVGANAHAATTRTVANMATTYSNGGVIGGKGYAAGFTRTVLPGADAAGRRLAQRLGDMAPTGRQAGTSYVTPLQSLIAGGVERSKSATQQLALLGGTGATAGATYGTNLTYAVRRAVNASLAELRRLQNIKLVTSLTIRERRVSATGVPYKNAIPSNATGGLFRGVGTGTSDSNLTRISNGEYVVNAEATRANLRLLDAINNDRLPRYATGGPVGTVTPLVPRSSGGDTINIYIDGVVDERVVRQIEEALAAKKRTRGTKLAFER